ncbi:MAG: hypothetical protein HUJ91_07595, partial [Bacteroidales bacterium]|nr:hypothetical protein [Bacteroidales bacterium]
MRRYQIVAILVFLAQTLGAQDYSKTALEQAQATDIWWNAANNASMLSSVSLPDYKDLSLNASLTDGQFRRVTSAANLKDVSLQGDALFSLSGFKVAASLSTEGALAEDVRYMSSAYPWQHNMPYFIASLNRRSSSWRNFDAGADVKVASPLMLNDALSVGIDINLLYNAARKMQNPTGNSSNVAIKIAPGVSYTLEDGKTLGFSFFYEKNPATTNLTPNPGTSIALMQGLGFFSSTLIRESDYYFACDRNSFGADFQAILPSDGGQYLIDVNFKKGITGVYERIDKICPLTNLESVAFGATLKGIFGERKNRVLTLGADYENIYGVEYRTNYDAEAQKYYIAGEQTRTRGSFVNALLNYDLYLGKNTLGEYKWKAGVGAAFNSELSRYYSTEETQFKTNEVEMGAYLGPNISLDNSSSLLVCLNAGYKFAVGTDYSFKGGDARYSAIYKEEA